MLYPPAATASRACTAPFVSDDEVEASRTICARRASHATSRASPRLAEEPQATRGRQVVDEEDLYDRAVAIVCATKASISYLQRRLGIGYNRAADLMERMEQDRVVSPARPAAGKRGDFAGPDDGPRQDWYERHSRA